VTVDAAMSAVGGTILGLATDVHRAHLVLSLPSRPTKVSIRLILRSNEAKARRMKITITRFATAEIKNSPA
jgi:hypothetical protein